MTNQVTFPTNVGGDGSTVTDDSNATTGLANGGFRVRLLPMFTQIIAIANWILGKANAVSTNAQNAAASELNASDSAGAAADSATAANTSAGNAAASAAAAAASAPLPSVTGNAGKILSTDGSTSIWKTLTQLLVSGATFGGKAHFTATDSASTALGNVSGTVNIDCSLAQSYSFTPTATTTLSLINPPAAGQSQVIVLKITNGAAFTLNFPAGTQGLSKLGTLTASGVDLLGAWWDADVSKWTVLALEKAVA
ncbi:hypothetical protein BCh11DRAFT_00251 [Burkholderia sp. Ch1-1]|nr:hypothetical protein BCh11DRAFT_00251 [Burkholderia sp. Ch1-1]